MADTKPRIYPELVTDVTDVNVENKSLVSSPMIVKSVATCTFCSFFPSSVAQAIWNFFHFSATFASCDRVLAALVDYTR